MINKIDQNPHNYQRLNNTNIIYIRNEDTEPLYRYIEAYAQTIIKTIIKTSIGIYCEPLNQQITINNPDWLILEKENKQYIYIPCNTDWTVPITVTQVNNILFQLYKLDEKPVGLIKSLENLIK